jgi:putative transposon-encoded protein
MSLFEVYLKYGDDETMEKQYFEIQGEELVVTNSKGIPLKVKTLGNSGHIILPKKYIGKTIKVIIE